MSASKCSEEFKQQVVLEVWIAIDTLTHYVVSPSTEIVCRHLETASCVDQSGRTSPTTTRCARPRTRPGDHPRKGDPFRPSRRMAHSRNAGTAPWLERDESDPPRFRSRRSLPAASKVDALMLRCGDANVFSCERRWTSMTTFSPSRGRRRGARVSPWAVPCRPMRCAGFTVANRTPALAESRSSRPLRGARPMW